MERYRVTYARASDLKRDLDTQIGRGGLYVLAAPPEDLAYGARCALEIVAPDGRAVQVEGAVLASTPGHGLAIAIGHEVSDALRAMLPSLPADGSDAAPARHERIGGDAAATSPVPAPAPASVAADVPASWDDLSPAEKMRLAQHGGRDERAAALRDRNRALHPHVLKNPRITLDEVVAIAKNAQAAPDLLRMLADRSEWMGRSSVADAIARNPKTPSEVAVRALAGCSAESLRQMAKGVGAPPNVVAAARKRVLG